MQRLSASLLLVSLFAALLGGCAQTHPLQPPAASVQQLRVGADGEWGIVLRIQNQSFAAMHVTNVRVELRVAAQLAGTLDASPALDIPPLSADVVEMRLKPAAAAAAALNGQSVAYALAGEMRVGKKAEHTTTMPLESKGWLSPVPGLSGVYR
ncbi:MAG: LEA type 2 family protein [Xanthomonadaceae bacterium]|nr:LEA type 2 family protein [Xanthomonadaceae bacterium]